MKKFKQKERLVNKYTSSFYTKKLALSTFYAATNWYVASTSNAATDWYVV